MRVLGIDPGIRGGVAWYQPGDLFDARAPGAVDAIDVPMTDHKKSQRRVDVNNLCDWINRANCDAAYFESIGPDPSWGVAQAARFFRTIGALEACVQGCGLEPVYVVPRVWKKEFGLLRTKADPKEDVKTKARVLMMQKMPMYAFLFERERDANKAEAALIAIHGAERLMLSTPKLRLVE